MLDDPAAYDIAADRYTIRRLLIKLSREARILPSSLFLIGVKCRVRESVNGGAFADIYRASYNGEPVALKRLRVFRVVVDKDSRVLNAVSTVISYAPCWSPSDRIPVVAVGVSQRGTCLETVASPTYPPILGHRSQLVPSVSVHGLAVHGVREYAAVHRETRDKQGSRSSGDLGASICENCVDRWP